MTKSGLYTATSNDQFSDWTEKKLQSTSQSQTQTCTKKGHVTVWRSAAYQIHYSFLNPGEIITSEKYAQQINEMQMKTIAFQQNGPNSPQQCWTAGHTTISKTE